MDKKKKTQWEFVYQKKLPYKKKVIMLGVDCADEEVLVSIISSGRTLGRRVLTPRTFRCPPTTVIHHGVIQS